MTARIGGEIPARRRFGAYCHAIGDRFNIARIAAILAGLVCALEEFPFDWFKIMVESATNPVAIRLLQRLQKDELL